MTEHKAWLAIAEAIETTGDEDGNFAINGRCLCGLCSAIAEIGVSEAVQKKMVRRLQTKRPRNPSAYWWLVSKAGNRRRAAVCRELAAETAPQKRKVKR